MSSLSLIWDIYEIPIVKNFPSGQFLVSETQPTLVKFHRWMKCLATSRAALPWTTEAMSCQGILGVVCLSMKSKTAEKNGQKWIKTILFPVFAETHYRCAYHQKVFLVGSSPCAQSYSSPSHARNVYSQKALRPPYEDFGQSCSLKHKHLDFHLFLKRMLNTFHYHNKPFQPDIFHLVSGFWADNLHDLTNLLDTLKNPCALCNHHLTVKVKISYWNNSESTPLKYNINMLFANW